MIIRPLQPGDLESVTEIYNEVLTHSTAVFRETLTTVEERTEWWNTLREKGYPILVADEAGRVLGFASLADFRPWPGYRFTVEGTIHLRPDARGQGIGTSLLKELISKARGLGKHILIAGVDADNAASLRLLAKAGFEQTAHMREVGYKFGRYLDLILLQYRLS